MKEEVKEAWVNALRSGEYEQGLGRLRTRDNKYCCIGVLCDIVDATKWSLPFNSAPDVPYRWRQGLSLLIDDEIGELGLSRQEHDNLTWLNDAGRSFEYIAEFIERNL